MIRNKKILLEQAERLGILTENNFTNKFNFIVGKKYEYDELPDEIRDDIDVQFYDDEMGGSTSEFYYEAKLLDPEVNLSDYFDWDFKKDKSYIKSLMKTIEKDGLDYPPVGKEGGHRALALKNLGKKIPYLDIIKKK